MQSHLFSNEYFLWCTTNDLVPYVFNKILMEGYSYTYQGPKGRHCQIHDFYNIIANAMQMELFFLKDANGADCLQLIWFPPNLHQDTTLKKITKIGCLLSKNSSYSSKNSSIQINRGLPIGRTSGASLALVHGLTNIKQSIR